MITQPVRVLHLITKLPIGGAQDNTILTVAGLDRGRYRVDLASSTGGAWEERARAAVDRLHLLPSLRRDMAPLADLRAIAAMAGLIRRERYAIVHTHSSKAGLLGRIAARLAGVPLVIHTVHGFPFNDQTFSPALRRLYLGLERLGARLSDRLILVAELNRQEALRRRLAPADRLQVIYSGIELGRFEDLPPPSLARHSLGLPVEARVAGAVGRLESVNAPDLLAKAAQALVSRYPDLHFLVVGDGKRRSEMAAALAGAPGRERIHFLGYRPDVPRCLAAMDVYLSASLWGGLGRALTEALAAGRPAVAFPVNGVPELLEDGVTGLHARPGDAADLAAQAGRLLDNPDWARRLAVAGRARVNRDFSADRMVAEVDTLYQVLLAQKGLLTGSVSREAPDFPPGPDSVASPPSAGLRPAAGVHRSDA